MLSHAGNKHPAIDSDLVWWVVGVVNKNLLPAELPSLPRDFVGCGLMLTAARSSVHSRSRDGPITVTHGGQKKACSTCIASLNRHAVGAAGRCLLQLAATGSSSTDRASLNQWDCPAGGGANSAGRCPAPAGSLPEAAHLSRKIEEPQSVGLPCRRRSKSSWEAPCSQLAAFQRQLLYLGKLESLKQWDCPAGGGANSAGRRPAPAGSLPLAHGICGEGAGPG